MKAILLKHHLTKIIKANILEDEVVCPQTNREYLQTEVDVDSMVHDLMKFIEDNQGDLT